MTKVFIFQKVDLFLQPLGGEAKQKRHETCVCTDLWFPCLSPLLLHLWSFSSAWHMLKQWQLCSCLENMSLEIIPSFFSLPEQIERTVASKSDAFSLKLSSEFDCLLIMCNALSASVTLPPALLSLLSGPHRRRTTSEQSSQCANSHTESVK